MYKLYLSFRYCLSRPINIIPVICMFLGVTALIVILAVMDGFQAQLRQTIRGTLSDLIVNVNYDSDVDKWEKVLSEIGGVKAFSPHLESFALLANVPREYPDGSEGVQLKEGAKVIGVDPVREAEVSSFREYLKRRHTLAVRAAREGTRNPDFCTPDPDRPFAVLNPKWFDKPGIILGRSLAEHVGVYEPYRQGGVWRYDRVNVTTLVRGPEGSDERFQARHLEFFVTGIYESGNQDFDRYVAYMPREKAKEFFEFKVDPQEIMISLEDYQGQKDRVQEYFREHRAEIYAKTRASSQIVRGPPFVVSTWEYRQRIFLSAIENEKALIAIICGMAFIVTGFMIFSILSMVVTMKTRDIGILKALGATTGGVARIFVLNGLIVGLVGAALGTAGGLAFAANINPIKEFLKRVFGWEPFPQDIYKFAEIPTRVIPEQVVIVVASAILVTLLGAILPAIRAARQDPVEALRYE